MLSHVVAEPTRSAAKNTRPARPAEPNGVFFFAFGLMFGIGIYTNLHHEPSDHLCRIVAFMAILAGLASILSAWQGRFLPVTLLLCATATGFSLGEAESAALRETAPQQLARKLVLTGQLADHITLTNHRSYSNILTLDRLRIAGAPTPGADWRAIIYVPHKRKITGSTGSIGTWLRIPIRRFPTRPPAAPGGVDFARHQFFHGIALRGTAISAPATLPAPFLDGPARRFALAMARLRLGLIERLQAGLPPKSAGLAIALTVGRRETLPDDVEQAMRDAGLAHILAISGLHLGIIAWLFYAGSRLALAAIPWLVLRWPIKKIAACLGIAGTTMYFLLAGNSVATERAFIVTLLALISILSDRSPFNVRLLTLAAIIILCRHPSSLVGAGFQMSFAAVLGLITVFNRLHTPIYGLRGNRIVRFTLGLVVCSLVAGLATAPYAAFHFHRIAEYGLMTNLIAIPLVSFVLMPLLVLMVFSVAIGLDTPIFALIQLSTEAMIALAQTVAALPGAVLLIPAFPAEWLAIFSTGFILICLSRNRIAIATGAIMAGTAILMALTAHQPDLLLARDGSLAVFQLSRGSLVVSQGANSSFARRNIFARYGIEERQAVGIRPISQQDMPSKDGKMIRCDTGGCVLTGPAKQQERRGMTGRKTTGRPEPTPGYRVIWNTDPNRQPESCRLATVLLTSYPITGTCRGPRYIFDSYRIAHAGSLAVSLPGSGGLFGADELRIHMGRRDRDWASLIDQ